MAHQADAVTPMDVVGEIHCLLSWDKHTFTLITAIVVNKSDVEVLAGIPFMTTYDVATCPGKHQIVIRGTEIIHHYTHHQTKVIIRCTQAYLAQGPVKQSVVLPGEFTELSLPTDSVADSVWALEPRLDPPTNQHAKLSKAWPPAQKINFTGHTLHVVNTTDEPIML